MYSFACQPCIYGSKLGKVIIGSIRKIKPKLAKFKQLDSFLSELVFSLLFSQPFEVSLFYAVTVFCYF